MSFNKKNINKSARITYKVFWNLIILFIVFTLVGLSFAGGVGAGYFASLVKDEPIRSYESMKKDIYNYEETTELYFDDHVYLGKLRSDLDRDEIKLDEVSEYVKKAVIATEDEYFYEHSGIVPKAILRAVFQEFTNSSVKSGGSTLTQQLIKNQILTNEVSFERKAKEIMLALRLERFFDKEEILEAYLNVVTFGRNSSGRNIAGVEAAAQGIFGISAKDLNLPQAAYIAGLPQSPFGYTPFTSKGEIKESIEPSLNRMETVLNRMLSAGYISEKEHEGALSYDILANFTPSKPSPVQKYPWLTFEIEYRAKNIMATILAEADGYTESDLEKDRKLFQEYYMKADRNLRRNGYKIYTTIDKQLYDKMQEIKNNYEYYGNDKPETITNPDTGETTRILEPVEVGGILIENKTGRIVSFIGGRDHQREQLNHATRGKRSNGSTMKPLLVYAPALELGAIHPGSVIADVDVAIPTGAKPWQPKNYGGNYHGFTSARYALAKSYNIPAAKTYVNIFDQNPAEYLKKMGFTSLTKNDPSHLSMALGAMDRGVTIEENVNAYATFGNYGKFIDAYMIEKIVSKDGETIYQHDSEPVDVFSPQTAYLTIDMMRDVISHGTAAGIPGKLKFKADWAGKTGTSQDYKDAWFVATNPTITFGLWMGYDTPKSLEKSYKGYSYSQRNQKLWAELMNAAYVLQPELVKPDENFNMPGGIVRRSYCAVSGLLPSDICKEAGLIKSDLFNAKHVPSKADDSLEKGKYVIIDNQKYRALKNSPDDLVKEGIMLKGEFLEKNGLAGIKNLHSILPKQDVWNSIVVPQNEAMTDNGYTPTPVSDVKMNGKTITWTKHYHPDIIGYRIYQATSPLDSYTKVASVFASNEDLSYDVKNTNAFYFVTAVDVVGKESSPSNSVSGGHSQEYQPPTNNGEGNDGNDFPLPTDPGNQKPDKPKDDQPKNDKRSNDGEPDQEKPKDKPSIPDPFDGLKPSQENNVQ